MQRLSTDERQVFRVLALCRASYSKLGIRFTTPNCADYRKSYQWRYLQRLTAQFDDWNLDHAARVMFLETSLAYMKEKNLQYKGISIFFQKNMLQNCFRQLEKRIAQQDSRVAMFERCHDFLQSQISKRGTLKDVLLRRSQPDMNCNLVEWYLEGKITIEYLACSSICKSVLVVLRKNNLAQRMLLPPISELYVVLRNVQEMGLSEKLRSILGTDWRELCPSR